MSTALIIAVGSRGDTEPFLALANALLTTSTFTHLHLVIQPDYAHLIPSHPRITIHNLPFTLATFAALYPPQFLKYKIRTFFTREPFDIVAFQRQCIALMVGRIILPALPAVHQIALQTAPSLVIASTLATSMAVSIADSLNIPTALLNLQPNVPTAAYPSYLSSASNAQLAADEIIQIINHPNRPHKHNPAYRATYATGFQASSLPVLNKIRASLSLPPLTPQHLHDITCGRYENPHVHIVNAYPHQLVPPGQDWSERVHQVPALADDYLPPGWDAKESCPNLVKFLEHGDEPLLVSFGSMRTDSEKVQVSRQLLTGLRSAGVDRVVILKGEADIGAHHLLGGGDDNENEPSQSILGKMLRCGAYLVQRAWKLVGLVFGRGQDEALRKSDEQLREWASEHVLHCSERVQYAWLLPQCSGMICHGGAGTVFAGLRAGLPVVVSPILCDQFFWGRLVFQLGIGALAGPALNMVESETVEEAVNIVRRDSVRGKARWLGEEIQKQGRGSEVAARVLASLAGPN